MVSPSWDGKRVLVFTQCIASRIRMAGDPAGFTLQSEPKGSAFCTSRRWGWQGSEESAGSRAGRHTFLTARWVQSPDQQTLLGLGCPCRTNWGTDLPSFSGKTGTGQAIALPWKGDLMRVWGFSPYIRVPGLGICQVPRTARQHLNIQWHLERGRAIRRWMKIKCQEKEKKRMMKREKVNQINQGNRHLEEAVIDPAVKETFWTRLPSSHRLPSPQDTCCS